MKHLDYLGHRYEVRSVHICYHQHDADEEDELCPNTFYGHPRVHTASCKFPQDPKLMFEVCSFTVNEHTIILSLVTILLLSNTISLTRYVH